MTLRELLSKTGDKHEYRPKHLLNGATVEMQKEETEYWHVADYAVSSRVGNTLFMVKREIEGGKEAGHTPLPWIAAGDTVSARGPTETCELVARCSVTRIPQINGDAYNEGLANARFICQAVNSHEALVEALENLLAHHRIQGIQSSDTLEPRFEACRAALAKAKGE